MPSVAAAPLVILLAINRAPAPLRFAQPAKLAGAVLRVGCRKDFDVAGVVGGNRRTQVVDAFPHARGDLLGLVKDDKVAGQLAEPGVCLAVAWRRVESAEHTESALALRYGDEVDSLLAVLVDLNALDQILAPGELRFDQCGAVKVLDRGKDVSLRVLGGQGDDLDRRVGRILQPAQVEPCRSPEALTHRAGSLHQQPVLGKQVTPHLPRAARAPIVHVSAPQDRCSGLKMVSVEQGAYIPPNYVAGDFWVNLERCRGVLGQVAEDPVGSVQNAAVFIPVGLLPDFGGDRKKLLY